MADIPPTPLASIPRIALRIVIIIAIAYAGHLSLDWVVEKVATLSPGSQSVMLTSILAFTLLAYALLIAVPFVPGIEIGLSLIIMRGPSIGIYVYGATVIGLTLAYLVGRYMPQIWLQRLLSDLRLLRASQLVDRVKTLSPAQRLDLMRTNLPSWLRPFLVSWRYVGIGLLINVPGNSLIGGGGGIAMMAGLSRVFTPRATILTIIIAVSPIPLLVWFYGIELFV